MHWRRLKALILKFWQQELFRALLVVIGALALRAPYLELVDLIDPTEARYANIAENMVLSHNWLTPMVEMAEGKVPYLGKPPLHFWLTAASYTLFGIDEWTTRLPTFLCALLILGTAYLFARSEFGKKEAIGAVLIMLSSVGFYFLSGASVTDVTLTLLVFLTVVQLCKFTLNAAAPIALAYGATLTAALGFLCKGPVSIVLSALPLVLWSAIRRDYNWARRFPWLGAIALFLLLVGPWFVLNEIAHPGSAFYFFWNENIGRYLFRDYGDRYGSGHIHWYGSAWLMLLGAFLPWSLLIFAPSVRRGLRRGLQVLKGDAKLLFLLLWAISTPLFFTFVRQLHYMYLLPAIPPLAMFSAVTLCRSDEAFRECRRIVHSERFLAWLLFSWVLAIAAALLMEHSVGAFLASCAVVVLGISSVSVSRRSTSVVGLITSAATLCVVTYLIVMDSSMETVNTKYSTDEIIEHIEWEANKPPHRHSIGVYAKSAFSPYWLAGAWKAEQLEQFDVKFVSPKELATCEVCHFLVRESSVGDLPLASLARFDLIERSGSWRLYRKRVAAPDTLAALHR